jgi:cytochrome c
MKFVAKTLTTLFASLAVASFSTGALAAADAEAAKALAKQNNCLKCHGVSKDKDGPSFQKVAAKYKGKADAVDKLVEHLMTGPKVKLPDGTEEEHKIARTTPAKDLAQIKNLINFILEH